MIAANTSFDGTDADIFATVTDYGFAMVAVDMDQSGDFGTDDLLLRLDDITLTSHLVAGDFI